MKKVALSAVGAAILIVAVWFGACSLGLDPAESGTTAISLTLPVLPSSGSPADERAVFAGGGFLFIQTGLTALDAKLYGPYAVSEGVPLVVTDISAGAYPSMAFVYVRNAPPAGDATPIIPATPTSDGYLAALQLQWTGTGNDDVRRSSSFRLLTDVQILPARVNTLAVSMIPTTDLIPTVSTVTYINLAATANTVTRRFVKLVNVRSGFIASGNTRMVCGASFISTDMITLYKVGLYDSEGHLLFWDANPRTLGMYPTEAQYTSVWNGGDTYYMYFEYKAMSMGMYLTFSGAP